MTIFETREELDAAGAGLIAQRITKLLATQDTVNLALPGGRSVAGIYRLLAHQRLAWERVHIFMVDERMVPITDPESNFRLVKENLAVPANFHPFLHDKGIVDYEKTLTAHGGRFDIILLSAGEDGHVAGLFPEHSIKDDSEFFLAMDDSPKPPPERMTSSRKLLLRSQAAILLFVGKAKHDALERFKDCSLSLDFCPAKVVLDIPESHILIHDE